MRVYNTDGVTVIDQDNEVLCFLNGVNPDDIEKVDISKIPLDLDCLEKLYTKAEGTKKPADADAYARLKASIIAWHNTRDKI